MYICFKIIIFPIEETGEGARLGNFIAEFNGIRLSLPCPWDYEAPQSANQICLIQFYFILVNLILFNWH